MRKRILLGIFVFGLIFFTTVIKTQSTNSLLSSDNQKNDQLNLDFPFTSEKLIVLSLTPHGYIEILNDANFTDYGFLGSGTALEPYLIENYNISSSKGIYINGTTKHFLIRNCYVDTESESIYISNVAEGTASIINNFVINNDGDSIYLYSSSGAILTNNTCRTNKTGVGIYLDASSGAILTDNFCYNSTNGIVLFTSNGVTITNNTCIDNKAEGILLSYSSGATLTDNTCTNNINGIWTFQSSDATLTDNTCSNHNKNGIFMWTSSGATLTRNTCTNSKFGDGIRLDAADDAILTDNICIDNGYGIYLSISNGPTLTDNICIDNDYGIRLTSCLEPTLTDNICSNSKLGDGIKVSSSSGATFTNNTCNSNIDGIALYSCSGATFTNNTCNNGDGYDLTQRWGIKLEYSDSCLFAYNLLQENNEFGIFLDSNSDNNIIHHSVFIDNNLGGTCQACDEGTNNTWYEEATEEGNYWNEWNEEEPYSIDGDVATDPYPLDENMERLFFETSSETDFEYILILPSLILVAILLKRKRNTYIGK